MSNNVLPGSITVLDAAYPNSLEPVVHCTLCRRAIPEGETWYWYTREMMWQGIRVQVGLRMCGPCSHERGRVSQALGAAVDYYGSLVGTMVLSTN